MTSTVASECAVVVSFVIMCVSNFGAQKKWFGGKDNKELSDAYPTYVTPDGLTFAIWGLIYMFEAVMVVAQVWNTPEEINSILSQPCPICHLDVRERLCLVFLANAIWLPLFNSEKFWSALGIMTIYLGSLILVYKDLNSETVTWPPNQLLFTVGIAMNLSWILVAFSVSVFFCAGLAGCTTKSDGANVAGSVPAAIVVVVLVTVLGSQRVFFAHDFGYAFVAAWALRGIYRMQSIEDSVRFPPSLMSSTLALCAKIGSGIIALSFILFGLFCILIVTIFVSVGLPAM